MKSKFLKTILFSLLLTLLITPITRSQALDTLKIKAEADSLIVVGDSLRTEWNIENAYEAFDKSYLKYQSIEDSKGQTKALSRAGGMLRMIGKYSEALDCWQKALAICIESGDRKGQGSLIGNIGVIHKDQTKYDLALSCFQQSLEIAREVSDKSIEIKALNNIGSIYTRTSQFPKALIYLEQCLSLSRDSNDLKSQINALGSIGLVHYYTSNYAEAISYYKQSLEITTQLNDLNGQNANLTNLGAVYFSLNDFNKAMEYFLKSIEITKSIGDKAGEAHDLLNIGSIHYEYSNYSKAIECYKSAQNIFEELQDRLGLGNVLSNLGSVYYKSRDYSNALECYQNDLEICRDLDDKQGAGYCYYNIGEVEISQGKYDDAMISIRKALEIQEEIKNKNELISSQLSLGKLYKLKGQDSLAVLNCKNAIRTAETIRKELIIENLKTTYSSKTSSIYADLILELFSLNKQSDAFDYSERARARSFLDLLASSSIKVGKPKDEELLQKNRELAKAESELQETSQSADQDTVKIATLRGKLDEETNGFMAVLEEKKREEPELASMVSVDPLTLPEVKQLLDKEETLLEYFLTDSTIIYWLVTRKDVQVFQVDVGGDSLKKLVMGYRDSIQAEGTTQELSRQLYNLLIAPAADKIKTSKLIVVPHGILHYLPFAALQDPTGKTLLERYQIRYLPSASVMKYLIPKRRPKGKNLLALGNPQSDRTDFPPIPYAEKEVKEIAAIYPNARVLTGAQATEDQFRNLAPSYDILHLACHSDLNAAYPLFSGLFLTPDSTQDGELDVHEIFTMDLNAYLVVLSGCQTGMGHLTNGDEVVGLSRAFFYAGTPSVLSSLWNVEDESTAYLMMRFYENLRKYNKGQSLRRAQQETREKFPNLRSWASFVLIGDEN